MKITVSVNRTLAVFCPDETYDEKSASQRVLNLNMCLFDEVQSQSVKHPSQILFSKEHNINS